MTIIADPISATIPAREVSTLIEAPGRLHLGFLDPDGSLGRRFASLGLVIEGMGTELGLAPAERDEVRLPAGCGGAVGERLTRCLETLRRATGVSEPVRLSLYRTPAAHAGFGSGTQLALAIGRAFSMSYGLAMTTREIARLLGRGERSGIGVAGFDHGGLLLDGGPGGGIAPLLARVDFPKEWRVLLVLDDRVAGLHGSAERLAIGRLPPFPRELAAELCHRVLMQLLPAAVEGDFDPFAEALSVVQRRIGDYFAPAQGGSPFTSPAVERVLEWVRPRYRAGIGQSSWGPTGFAVLPSAASAEAVAAEARAAGVVEAGLRLSVVGGRNRGALVGGERFPRLGGC